jgi:non-canonical purine NTP pyrophosphatase (RdgB/HAM1 family)
MSLYFITGSKNKFREASAVLPVLKQLDIDLPEIQEIDAKKIIEAKLQEALKHRRGEFIVEDTSLYLDGLNGLPGPLIKWFLLTVGNNGLFELAKGMDDDGAEAKTIIGYTDGKSDIRFFTGTARGKIIAPRGETNFGWDPIFLPEGYGRTFAEMEPAEKNKISMRRMAFSQLKEFLSQK